VPARELTDRARQERPYSARRDHRDCVIVITAARGIRRFLCHLALWMYYQALVRRSIVITQIAAS